MFQSALRTNAVAAPLLLLFLAAPLHARTLTIDFDSTPAGSPLDPGDEISNAYASQGVTFSTIDNGGDDSSCIDDGGVYVGDDRGSRNPTFGSEPNVVTLCAPGSFASDFTEILGEIVATFTRDVQTVCINVLPVSTSDSGWLEAYTLGGVVPLDTATSSSGSSQKICVAADAEGPAIRSVHFSAPEKSPVSDYARFDDLEITFAPLVIDFDLDASNDPIGDGDDLATRYESQGVLFDKVEGTGTCGAPEIAYASDDRPVGFGSVPNVVTACNTTSSEFSDDTHGRVRAVLLATARKVCILSQPDPGARGELRVYDAEGEPITTVTTEVGEEEEICATVPGIRVAEFAGQGTGQARFDDLVITFGGAQVDFDRDSLAQPISSGTAVNTVYANSGIAFSRTSGSNCGAEGMVYANDDQPEGFGSEPNIVSVCSGAPADFSEASFGMIRATFIADATSACIDVRPTESDDSAVLRAYDVGGGLLEEAESEAGSRQILCVSSAGIRSVEFSGNGTKFARFDDFTAVIPEPHGATLGLAAVFALTAARRARRR